MKTSPDPFFPPVPLADCLSMDKVSEGIWSVCTELVVIDPWYMHLGPDTSDRTPCARTVFPGAVQKDVAFVNWPVLLIARLHVTQASLPVPSSPTRYYVHVPAMSAWVQAA
jgi:hypothetical protein